MRVIISWMEVLTPSAVSLSRNASLPWFLNCCLLSPVKLKRAAFGLRVKSTYSTRELLILDLKLIPLGCQPCHESWCSACEHWPIRKRSLFRVSCHLWLVFPSPRNIDSSHTVRAIDDFEIAWWGFFSVLSWHFYETQHKAGVKGYVSSDPRVRLT